MTPDIIAAKIKARRTAAIVRDAAHERVGADAAVKLASHRFPVHPAAGHSAVSAFFPHISEIDTRSLLGRLAGEGWTTALPIVIAKGQPLEFRQWWPGAPTVTGVMGIPRPPDSSPLVEPDVLLVPMLAFDREGYRLGYGGGFYDRTLEKLRGMKRTVAIGVAYAAQEVDSVPHDGHDQRLDFVMTEAEVFACG